MLKTWQIAGMLNVLLTTTMSCASMYFFFACSTAGDTASSVFWTATL